jgi:hypothetical protein
MSSLSFRSLMNLRSASSRRIWGRAHRRPAWRFAPRLVPLEARALLSTITVKNDGDSGSGSLRAAIAGASAGDTINFAPSAYGTITLSSGPLVVPNINLTIQGPGANKLTISGNDTYTVFELGIVPHIPQTPSSMTISGLTIANGNATSNDDGGSGGGIAEAVNLTLADSVLENNQAPDGSGGGISNGFPEAGLGLTIVNDVFADNTAGSASVGFFRGFGGAIDAENGSNVSVISSTFVNNQSIAPQAQGGAINLSTNTFEFPNSYGSLSVTGSTFRGNVASSNSAFGCCAGWSAAGGAIWADPQVGVTIGSSQFLDNEAELAVFSNIGGLVAGGAIDVNPGAFGFPAPPPSAVTITNTLFSGNMAVGTGTSGSQAEGGALNAGGFGGGPGGGTITISGSTFTANQAMGDSSSINPSDEVPGPAQGGAINTYLDALALTSDIFSANEAVGGSGQGVQYAFGGAIYSQLFFFSTPNPTLTTTISDSLFTGNQAIGGTGVPSFNTETEGGALALTDTPASVTNTSFIGNQALGSPGTSASAFPPFFGPLGIGGAVETSGAAMSIQGGLISGNVASGGKGGDASAGTGGPGGYAWGGGIFVGGQGSLTIAGTTIAGNSAQGGAGGQGTTGGNGGFGQGGGVYVFFGGSAKLVNATIIGNTAKGGAAGKGTTLGVAGDAQGGGVFEFASTLKISGGVIAGNSAVGGQGGGNGEGGGVFNSGTSANASLTDVLVALNSAIGGSGGGKGYGGGLYIATGVIAILTDTEVAGNFATTSNNNIYGPYTTG